MLAIAHRAPASREEGARLAALGVTVFEIDVQLLGGRLVVSHYLPVHPHPSMARVRRDRWEFTTRRRAPREIDLAGALGSVPAGVEVLLDLKNDRGRHAADLAQAVVSAGLDRTRCHVATKGWQVLRLLRAEGFRTWRSVGDRSALVAVLAAAPLPDHAVTVRHTLLTPDVVSALRATGTLVMAWTVNDIRRAAELARLGIDGITSDSPRVLALVGAAGPGPPQGAAPPE